MKRVLPIFLVVIFLGLIGCKPTEKGYKAAYDAALGKREAVKADLDADVPEGALQEFDGPQLKEVDGVNVFILNQRIRAAEVGQTLPGKYHVAVGMYKMITNCKSQVEALREGGYEAYVAKDVEGIYYTIAASFASLSEAVKFYEKYQKEKDRVYVGLPNAPVIIYS